MELSIKQIPVAKSLLKENLNAHIPYLTDEVFGINLKRWVMLILVVPTWVKHLEIKLKIDLTT